MKQYSSYKDSGVEWIGEIPSSWASVKMKHLVKICNGKDYKHIQLEDGGYPVFGTGGEFARCSDYLCDKPSVLLGRKGTINKPQIVWEPFWTSDTIYYTEIGDKILPIFFYHLVHQIPFHLFEYGSAIPSMTKTDYDEMRFPLPPLTEQDEIVSYLVEQTQKVDEEIRLEVRKIQLLKDYRTSLISNVVTGKINVQEEVMV